MTRVQSILKKVAEIFLSQPQPRLEDRGVLIGNLIFLWHTMRASENLLKVATFRSAPRSALRQYYARHLQEERGHEEWLAADLLSANVDVTKTRVVGEARSMCGCVYYEIYHLHPAALLGYMLTMESFPIPAARLAALEKLHGKDLLRTIRHHSIHDIEHARDLHRMIDSLDPLAAAVVEQTALRSAVYIASALGTLAAAAAA